MSSAPFPELSSHHQPAPVQELHGLEMSGHVAGGSTGSLQQLPHHTSSHMTLSSSSSSTNVPLPSTSQQQSAPPTATSSQQQAQQQSSSKEGSAGTSPASSSLGLPGGISAQQSPQRSSVTTPTHQQQHPHPSSQTGGHGSRHPTNFNPLIYGNDVDSVDVATRIAMVSIYLKCFINNQYNFFDSIKKVSYEFSCFSNLVPGPIFQLAKLAGKL